MRVSFGDCTFDSDTRELFRGGKPVHLSPKAFRLLELLLEERPRALSKQQLQEKLWPRTFVSEANLAGLATEARRAIGDSAKGSKLLRTVYGFGYAFSGEVTEEHPAAAVRRSRFLLVRDDEEIPLGRAKTSSAATSRPRPGSTTTRFPEGTRASTSRRRRHDRGSRQQERHVRGRQTGRRKGGAPPLRGPDSGRLRLPDLPSPLPEEIHRNPPRTPPR